MAANPVTEVLQDWQPDAASNDTNHPIASSGAGIGDAQDLSGNLRLLKSVMRGLSAHMAWENWKGIRNLADAADIAFTYVSANVFTVNDNFSSSGARFVAVVGRRVRATIVGSTLTGIISTVVWSSPNTTITIGWDSGALDATLSDVEFGPDPYSIGLYQSLGMPINLAITNAGFLFAAAGLTKVNFADLAGNPSALGQMARSGDLLLYHDGTGVHRVPFGKMARKSGDQTIIHSDGYVTASGLTVPIGANETMLLDYTLRCSSSLSSSALLKVIAPALAAGWYGNLAGVTAASGIIFQNFSGGNFEIGSGSGLVAGGNTTSALTVSVKAIVVNGANAGDIDLQFSELTGVSGNFTMHDSCFVEARRYA